MNAKKWYESTTVWFNVVTGLLAVLALPQFIAVIPAGAMPYIALLAAIGNWYLRVYKTSQPIA